MIINTYEKANMFLIFWSFLIYIKNVWECECTILKTLSTNFVEFIDWTEKSYTVANEIVSEILINFTAVHKFCLFQIFNIFLVEKKLPTHSKNLDFTNQIQNSKTYKNCEVIVSKC